MKKITLNTTPKIVYQSKTIQMEVTIDDKTYNIAQTQDDNQIENHFEDAPKELHQYLDELFFHPDFDNETSLEGETFEVMPDLDYYT